MEKLQFETKEGSTYFYIIDETRINGRNYLLVTDSEDENDPEAEALILKDTSLETDSEAVYEIVEDETELMAVAKVFEEIVGDIEFE